MSHLRTGAAVSRYYNRHGRPISQEEGLRLFGELNDSRQVADDRQGEVRVSTVHLVIDHSFGDGPPVIFETMIFGGEHDKEQWRYSTLDEAREGHQRAVELAFG